MPRHVYRHAGHGLGRNFEAPIMEPERGFYMLRACLYTGMDGGTHGMHAGGSRSAVSAITGASSAFISFSKRSSSGQLQPPAQPKEPCTDGHCIPPPDVQHPQRLTIDSISNGDDHYQPQGTPTGGRGCQEDTGETPPASCHDQPEQHCALAQQPAGMPPSAPSMASGVDVSIHEAQSVPPKGCPAPQQAAVAVRPSQKTEHSEEETVISDTPQQRGRKTKKGATPKPIKRATPSKEAPQEALPASASGLARERRTTPSEHAPPLFLPASVSGLTGDKPSQDGGRLERAKRRALLVAERAARSQQEAWHGAADRSESRDLGDSFLPHESSGLDGSQGAAWGLATMLQVACLQHSSLDMIVG